MTFEEWHAEGVRRFGDDPMKWRFVCPTCGHDAMPSDWGPTERSRLAKVEVSLPDGCVMRSFAFADADKADLLGEALRVAEAVVIYCTIGTPDERAYRRFQEIAGGDTVCTGHLLDVANRLLAKAKPKE